MSIMREEIVLNTPFIGALIAALLLSGCADRPLNTCPAPIVYSDAFQAEAADALEALPPGSPLGQMIVDYGAVRAKLRACRK